MFNNVLKSSETEIDHFADDWKNHLVSVKYGVLSTCLMIWKALPKWIMQKIIKTFGKNK